MKGVSSLHILLGGLQHTTLQDEARFGGRVRRPGSEAGFGGRVRRPGSEALLSPLIAGGIEADEFHWRGQLQSSLN
ncbi:hypothetical protein PBY51_019774 [Eleginops maclovinus]|uniref:Uncharacterized protein n=1 Tax=Eleginops maclovinus TaxID=56733 RepID=A0AAN8ASJ1_ELEMC|nr:hypothetical protein PBY51_019774 [Eleginops maclovinus]